MGRITGAVFTLAGTGEERAGGRGRADRHALADVCGEPVANFGASPLFRGASSTAAELEYGFHSCKRQSFRAPTLVSPGPRIRARRAAPCALVTRHVDVGGQLKSGTLESASPWKRRNNGRRERGGKQRHLRSAALFFLRHQWRTSHNETLVSSSGDSLACFILSILSASAAGWRERLTNRFTVF